MASDVARINKSRNHYEALNLAANASADEVKAAYRALSLQCHPDKCREPGAEEAFKRLAEAHRVLGDPMERRRYELECSDADIDDRDGIIARAREAAERMQRQSQAQAQGGPPQYKTPSRGPWEPCDPPAPSVDVRALVAENAELARAVHQLKHELEWTRQQEKARETKRAAELSVAKRASVEAKAERDRVKRHWEERLASDTTRHEREKAEARARLPALEAEVSRLREASERSAREAAALKLALRVLTRCGGIGALLPSPPPLPKELATAAEAAEARRPALLQAERAFNAALSVQVEQLVARRVAEKWARSGQSGGGGGGSELELGPVGRAEAEAAAAEISAVGAQLEYAYAAGGEGGAEGGGEGGGGEGGGGEGGGGEGGQTSSFSVEQDGFGNYVVVERDAVGAITCSAQKLASEAKWAGGALGSAAVSGGGGAAGGTAGGGSAAACPPEEESMSDALRSILRRLGLEQLVGTLEDEELYSVPMLQSMGPMFEANMRELGLSDERAIGRLKTALSM